MLRWTLSVVTGLLVVAWLASGFPGVRWHWPEGERQEVIPRGRGLSKDFRFTRETREERTLWTATVYGGSLWLARYRSAQPEVDFELELLLASLKGEPGRWLAWPAWRRTTHVASTYTWAAFHIFIPLWIPPLLTGIPAALLWRRRLRILRRRRAGACLHCGYALAGLPADEASGKPTCPECGT